VILSVYANVERDGAHLLAEEAFGAALSGKRRSSVTQR
jgi:hypothetical protein